MNKKKIIIFGATGNVGSYLHKYALDFFDKNQFSVVASGRRKTDFFKNRGFDYIAVDITKKEDFNLLPTKDVYAVMLLSAEIPSYMEDYDARKYIDSIIVGGYNVLEYCRKVNADRIIYTQTVFDISLYPHETLKPDLPPNFSYTGDHAMYVIAKNTMLEMLKHYKLEYGLKSFVFRLPTIYSYSPYPFYFPKGVKTKRPIYIMIDKAINSEPIEVYGDGSYAKDMVHVYDFSQEVCKAVLANVEGGVYNVGTGNPITIEEQIKTIIEVFSPKDNPSPIIYRKDKTCGGGFLMDINNAREDLGYEPKYSCKDLFLDYKNEMKIKRFEELRLKN